MKRIARCIAFLVLIFPATALSQSISQTSLDKAKAELLSEIESGQVAGGSHLVVLNGKAVYFEAAGVADIETKQPFQADTIVRIYSMTKPITSVAAMTLYEQGKFSLDDPVSKFIPAFEQTTVLVENGDTVEVVAAERQITVRDLFRHSTGFSYGSGDPKVREYYQREGMLYRPPQGMLPPAMTIAEAADALARIPALHQPGAKFTYGFNTDLLGRLVEIWSGQPLNEYMQKAICEPLDMVDTGFSIPPEKRNRFASCHTWKDGKLAIVDKASSSPFNEGFAFLSGGGGLVSTIHDYANFCQMMVNGGEFKGNRVLKEDTVKLMFTDQFNGAGGVFQFGLGFAIGDVTLGTGDQQHKAKQYSWGGYASTSFRLVPEQHLFQIVFRQRIPSENDLANKMITLVYEGVEDAE